MHNPGKEGYRYDVIHPITNKPCKQPLMGYRFPKTTMDDLIKDKRILYGKDENKIIELKVYAKDFEDKLSSVFDIDGRLGPYDIRELLGSNVFTNPKPVQVILKLISYATTKNSLIIDFFSGSSTSAHAVMQLNVDDGGSRKCISIQLPEPCKVGSEAQKAGYTTIDQIGMERIIRAAKKIKEENPEAYFDYGFKHYTLCEPNGNTLDKLERFDKNTLFHDATVLDDFGIPTVLTTWMVNDGYGFTEKANEIDLGGYSAYHCGKHLYFVDPHLSPEAIAKLFEKYVSEGGFNPENIVLFGYSFSEWYISEMLEKNIKLLNDSEKNLKINIDIRY